MNLFKFIRNQGGDTFQVMLVTLNMLLLAFFIVLNSIAVIEEEKKMKALGSLLGTFGILSKGLNPEFEKGSMTLPPSSEITAEEVNIMDFLQNLERYSLEERLGESISVQIGKERIKIFMTAKIIFKEGSAELTPIADRLLKLVAMVLSKIEGKINIIGHTNPGSYRAGPYPDDWTLSWARAGNAARNFLKTELIKPKRITISGYASTRPFMGGGTPVKERFNDRLGVILEKRKGF